MRPVSKRKTERERERKKGRNKERKRERGKKRIKKCIRTNICAIDQLPFPPASNFNVSICQTYT